jgi:hypothetical protein
VVGEIGVILKAAEKEYLILEPTSPLGQTSHVPLELISAGFVEEAAVFLDKYPEFNSAVSV